MVLKVGSILRGQGCWRLEGEVALHGSSPRAISQAGRIPNAATPTPRLRKHSVLLKQVLTVHKLGNIKSAGRKLHNRPYS